MAYFSNAPADEQIAAIKMRAEALVRDPGAAGALARVGLYGDLKEPEWQPLMAVRLPNGEPVLGVWEVTPYDFRIIRDPHSTIALALARRIVAGVAPDAQSSEADAFVRKRLLPLLQHDSERRRIEMDDLLMIIRDFISWPHREEIYRLIRDRDYIQKIMIEEECDESEAEMGVGQYIDMYAITLFQKHGYIGQSNSGPPVLAMLTHLAKKRGVPVDDKDFVRSWAAWSTSRIELAE